MSVTQESVEEFLAPYLQFWEAYAADAWAWAKDCVRTRDEDAAPGMPREHLPLPNLPHLEWVGGK